MIGDNLFKILSETPELAKIADRLWRINHLYWIKDPWGNRIKFNLNWAQKVLWDDPHPLKIILKARQLGITTYSCLTSLDHVLWNDNLHTGIIAHTQDDAMSIFQDKLKFAFEQLHPNLRKLFRIVGDSARELSFTHGSTIRVGTSLRSSTLQHLHISEFGKICAKYPEKAREVISGALNTLAAGQGCIIESTAEGKDGAFHDIWQLACKQLKEGRPFGPLDFKPFFFPWWKEPSYSIGVEANIPADMAEYFDKLSLEDIHLSLPQKWWYVKKKEIQREDMTREYPSTPDEAFSASQDGYWFASYMKEMYDAGRVCNIAYDRALPVHTAWDLGQADCMSIWFFQINRSDDVNIIDFWQKNNTPLDQIMILLKGKGYNYGTHIWPHDANARDRAGITFVMQARPLGLTGMVLEPHSFIDGINQVRTSMSKMWFDKTKCAAGLKMLENYKKKWNSSFGGWTSEAVHDSCSHCADSMRYLVAGLARIQGRGDTKSDALALRKYFGEGR